VCVCVCVCVHACVHQYVELPCDSWWRHSGWGNLGLVHTAGGWRAAGGSAAEQVAG
jgi:hypothetical protein